MLSIEEFKLAFNAKAVLTPAEKWRLRMFKEFGAYNRTIAKNSMIDVNAGGDESKRLKAARKLSQAGFILAGGREVSKPGAAAFSRLGWIKQHIYFAADKDGVVIGPAKLQGLKSPPNALDALEHGGTEQIQVGKKIRLSVTATYKARPTMGLAFAKTKEKKLPRLIQAGIMREV